MIHNRDGEGAGDKALTRPFDLSAAFAAKQNALLAALNVPAAFTAHGTTIGDASEADWVAMLREFLPGRYGVGPIFAVDCDGRSSQQIDVAVYDQHYAPLWFETPTGTLFVPVESVYAAFEVKQRINKTYADYTGTKLASVRALRRTSAKIRHAGGVYNPQNPKDKPILGGILTTSSGWTHPQARAAVVALAELQEDHRIDLGIALDSVAFSVDRTSCEIAFSPPGRQLIYFAVTLFERLQALGTALAVEIPEYARHLADAPMDEG